MHHGDGVERMFWDDPRVLTVSIHESGQHLFPGTGWPADVGGPSARGTVANVALPPATGDSSWLRALESVAAPLVRGFDPDVLVSQHGCDTHMHDPLAHLAITVDAQRRAHETLHDLAHEVAGGRWVALGGGGYELVEVVPRSWAHLTAIAAHVPVSCDTAVPQEWLDHVERLFGRRAPGRMGDLPLDRLPIWVRPVGPRAQPRRPRRPGHPRDAPGGVPAPRDGPLVRLRTGPDAGRAPSGARRPGVSAGQGGEMSSVPFPSGHNCPYGCGCTFSGECRGFRR